MSEKPRIESRYSAPEQANQDLLEGLYELDWVHMLPGLQPITSFYLSAQHQGVDYWKRNLRARVRDIPPRNLTELVGTNLTLELKTGGEKLSQPYIVDTSLAIVDEGMLANISGVLGEGVVGYRLALASMRDYLLPQYCFNSEGVKVTDYPRVTIDSGYEAIVYDELGQMRHKLPFGWLKIEVKCLLDELEPCQQVFTILEDINAKTITTDTIKEQIEEMVNRTGLIQLIEV